MNRSERRQLAEDTLAVIDANGYNAPTRGWIDLRDAIADATTRARLITPQVCADLVTHKHNPRFETTRVEVCNETTLAGGRALLERDSTKLPLCLNFASAKSPGGGFLSGSQAQEESIARVSTLYPTLMQNFAYYEINRKHNSPLYTDHAILSPRVTVFRDEDGCLLDSPFDVAVLTAPAPNAGAARSNGIGDDEIGEVMQRRIKNVLAIAASEGYTSLVLGAWGCGVFKNNAGHVAAWFNEQLTTTFAGVFESVRFSVLDGKSYRPFIGPFEAEFGHVQEVG